MAVSNDLPVLTIILLLTACIVSLFLLGTFATSYSQAYFAAPSEITTFIDTVDFSIQENESYDKDVGKVTHLEDKLRMGRLLSEIQKCGDDLREDLNRLLIEDGIRLRSSTRILWAAKRPRLEERMRRLDLLRMRFLVVYMGLIAAKSTADPSTLTKDPEKQHHTPKMHLRPNLPHAMTEAITRKPPLRRLTTQAIGHNNASVGSPQKMGWAGVVAELRNSPLMHKRHASIETSMASPT